MVRCRPSVCTPLTPLVPPTALGRLQVHPSAFSGSPLVPISWEASPIRRLGRFTLYSCQVHLLLRSVKNHVYVDYSQSLYNGAPATIREVL
ncbi:hypothetical protein BV20DRAFT_739147 [Pilatotrama ljubarskyi]|nr:hypothetical protein BV20DRAFT_739147 [Pilatotrama ljubarskyi]